MANEGTIRKRSDRRGWEVSVHIDGERIRRMAATKPEAKRLLAELQQTRTERRRYVPLRGVLQPYLASLRIRAKRSSVDQAEINAGNLERHFGHTFDASSLTGLHLDEFIAKRLRKVARSTVNGDLRVLRAALRMAVDQGTLPRLPCRVKLLREPKRVPRVLTPADVERLLEHARPPFDLMILIAARSGLRHQEILHLQVGDVDPRGRTLHVSAKQPGTPGAMAGWLPKSHCERVVPFGDRLARALEAHIGGLKLNGGGAWLFPGHEGGPRAHAHERIRDVFKAAGLYDPELKPGLHSLRRTWATQLLGNGADIETVRQLGGWADLVTVQRYITSTDDLKRRAIEALD